MEEKIRSLESVILERNKADALLTEREQRVEDGELDNDVRPLHVIVVRNKA